ncbi:MAG: hypothetical protein ACI9CF_000408 [Candidatus Omnitrophota bacterium]|jgi:hypothetical protein
MNKVMPIMLSAIVALLTLSINVQADDVLQQTGKVITKSIGVVAEHTGGAIHATGQVAGKAVNIVAGTGQVIAHPVASADASMHAVGAASKGAVDTTIGATKTVVAGTGQLIAHPIASADSGMHAVGSVGKGAVDTTVGALEAVTNFVTRK